MKDFPAIGKKKSHRLIRKQLDSQDKVSLKLAVTLAVLILVATVFIQQRIAYIRTERHVRQLMLEKRAIQTEILPLKLEERYLTHFDKTERTAKQELGLIYPRKSQMITLAVKKEPVQ